MHGPAVWLPFVQPFGTVFLGVGAGLIAYRQWRTAHNRLRLDLFDKRLANFNSLMHFLDRYRNSKGLDKASRAALGSVILASDILFGDDMTNLLHEAELCIDRALSSGHDEQSSALFLAMAKKVDRLQFEMRDVLKRYAGMSRVR